MSNNDVVIASEAGERSPLILRFPVEYEGRFIRQTSCPSKYGHVVLRFEPVDEPGVMLRWNVDEDVIPSSFKQSVADGIAEALRNHARFEHYVLNQARVTVVGGSYNSTDSTEFAYKVAAALAVEALTQSDALTPKRWAT
jgi:elongation factor G